MTSLPPEISPAVLASIEHELRSARKHFPHSVSFEVMRERLDMAIDAESIENEMTRRMLLIQTLVIGIRILQEGSPSLPAFMAFARKEPK